MHEGTDEIEAVRSEKSDDYLLQGLVGLQEPGKGKTKLAIAYQN